jgi:hypothetical protein
LNGDFSEKLDQILGNPAMLSQIKALADTMTTADAKPQPPPPEEPPAPRPFHEKEEPHEPLSAAPVLFTPSPTLEKNLKHTRDLLIALKPFLDEKRCAKIDKMLSMMRLAEMAGQFGSLF